MIWNSFIFVSNYSGKAYLYLWAWVNYTTLNITLCCFVWSSFRFPPMEFSQVGLSILLVLCPSTRMTQLFGGHLASCTFCHSQQLSCLPSVFWVLNMQLWQLWIRGFQILDLLWFFPLPCWAKCMRISNIWCVLEKCDVFNSWADKVFLIWFYI